LPESFSLLHDGFMEKHTQFPLHESWRPYLELELNQDYMKNLSAFLRQQIREKKNIFPKPSDIFKAYNSCSFQEIKVVIIGQDPYHGTNQAHGLCFSVLPPTKPPPSLQNIFKELQTDLGLKTPNHGELTYWASQGVFLLNDVLTVEEGKAHSHKDKGWERFTDKTIEHLNTHHRGLIFFLWGSPAQKKGQKIDEAKHFVLRAPHPSPLSSYRGFFGCKHFSIANKLLVDQGKKMIDWQLKDI
jgi:uracil-DNA glycosylase